MVNLSFILYKIKLIRLQSCVARGHGGRMRDVLVLHRQCAIIICGMFAQYTTDLGLYQLAPF